MLGQVVGIPGVGKTSVINGAIELLKKDGYNVDVVSFGSVLLEILKRKEGISNRDEIRKKVPKDRYINYQIEAARRIGELKNKYDILFVDNHFLINTNFGYHPGIHKKMEEEMETDFVVLIVAYPDEILYRRISDETRNRDIEPLWRINLQQEMTINFANIYAHFYNTPIIVINNRDGMLDVSIRELYEKIKALLRE